MRALALLALLWVARADVIDRIAVTVGKIVITESEVLTNLKVAAFLNQREPDLSGAEKHKTAERLVDLVLLRMEVPSVGDPDTTPAMTELKKRYPTPEAFREALKHYGISEQDVERQIWTGMESLGEADRRFRPEIQVTEEEVRAHYDKLAGEWKAKNAAVYPGFEASRGQVQELLINSHVSEALEKWLEMAREQTSIVYRDKVFE
jgi:parvulin-like peptidyl-prolyl isomerase